MNKRLTQRIGIIALVFYSFKELFLEKWVDENNLGVLYAGIMGVLVGMVLMAAYFESKQKQNLNP